MKYTIKTKVIINSLVFGVIYINPEIRPEEKDSFSPLRFWGYLYLDILSIVVRVYVLVPFVFGVIYITSDCC